MQTLPETDDEQVAALRKEWEELSRSGDSRSTEGCFRLVWGLVHSKRRSDVEQGLQLAHALLQSDEMDSAGKKDLVYFCCVAKYKLGKYVESRQQLDEFLKTAPNHRQAKQLKEAVEGKIVKEGLIGVGLLSSVAIVGGIAAALLSRK